MPRKEIKFVCDVCGTKYLDEKVAEQCEHKHYRPIEITNTTYDQHESKREYPSTITVKLTNGEGKEKTIVFSRK